MHLSMDYTTDRGIAEALNLRPFILSCSVPLLDEVNDRLNREPSARTKTLMTFCTSPLREKRNV